MARYLGSACKVTRRIGTDLFLKRRGRDIETKCKLGNRPGQHGGKKTRSSDYSLQLTEKQKLKYMYGVLEKQLLRYFAAANARKGPTGENLLQILESRLDNVVYRLGFGGTRAEARQLVRHKAIQIKPAGAAEAHTVNIPSYQVQPGDEISVREKAKNQTRIHDALKISESAGFPDWVQVNTAQLSGALKNLPERDQLSAEINEQLVVELYSK